MTDRRERIPAAEITDPKRWNLPYWTTPPHVIQAEREEKAKALAKAKAEQALAEIGDEEIEIEVQPYTAEQLENIRQQAYNEGLEQGLIEGRQKGETLGHEVGYQEGLSQGLEAGKASGEEQGRQAIEQKLKNIHLQQAQEQAQQVSAILKGMQNFLTKQSKNIEKVLPELVEKLAQAVVGEELNQGSEHIVSLVKLAMDSLPLSSDHLHIELNEADVPYLEAAFENADFSAKIQVNKQISAGGCKIKTQHSNINFTVDERWQRIVQQYHEQLSLASLNEDDAADDPMVELKEPLVEAFSEETVTQLLAELSPDERDKTAVENELTAENNLDLNSDAENALLQSQLKSTDLEQDDLDSQTNTESPIAQQLQTDSVEEHIETDAADASTLKDALTEEAAHESLSENNSDETLNAKDETQHTQSPQMQTTSGDLVSELIATQSEPDSSASDTLEQAQALNSNDMDSPPELAAEVPAELSEAQLIDNEQLDDEVDDEESVISGSKEEEDLTSDGLATQSPLRDDELSQDSSHDTSTEPADDHH